jgi:hypothetical protein
MYFDSTNNVTKVYNGTDWQAASSSIEGIKSDFQYTATASQVLFSGSDDNTNTLVIDKAGLTNVFLNGVRLVDSDYTVDVGANSVTLASGASVNDVVEIEVFGNFAGQSGADVAITGGSITGLTELSTGTFTSTGIDDNATSTAITIDASENVGIGTASPSAKLEIEDGDFARLDLNLSNATGTTICDVRGLVEGTEKWRIGKTGSSSDDFTINVGGSERARIDSSGNLLVGTTSGTNSKKLSVVGDSGTSIAYIEQTTGSSSNDAVPALALNRQTRDGKLLTLEKGGSGVGSIGVESGNNLYIDCDSVNHAGIMFWSGASSSEGRITPRFNGTGADGNVDLGRSNNRFQDLYLSGGVYLGGTGAANKLDDYEEGTFTPTVTGSTTAGSHTVTYAGGSYTKIGRKVTAIFVYSAYNGTGSGNMVLGGFPFSIDFSENSGTVFANSGVPFTSGRTNSCVVSSSTAFQVREMNPTGGGHSVIAYPTAPTYLRTTVTYFTND